MARECAVVRIVCHTLGRHHPRKRMIQYSETPAMESKSRGLLDAPLEPVIGLAKGETRWRGMTTVRMAQLADRLCGLDQPRARRRRGEHGAALGRQPSLHEGDRLAELRDLRLADDRP